MAGLLEAAGLYVHDVSVYSMPGRVGRKHLNCIASDL
jgi:hypothetical protein